jgi:uncharacterized protein
VSQKLVDSLALQVLGIAFIATVIRSTFGFGEAMVAVPLLSLRLPVHIAVPLAALLSMTVGAIVVAQDWRHIHVRSAGGLLLASLFGIPIGVFVLKSTDDRMVKSILGGFLIIFATYAMLSRQLPHLQKDHPAVLGICGFIAGVLGGAYSMNGPALVIYGSLRRWSPQHFRSTLQAYFFPASVVGLCGYLYLGLWTMEVTRYYLICLPVTVLAVLIGRSINRRLKDQSFLRFVYVGLIAIGATLIYLSVRKHSL